MTQEEGEIKQGAIEDTSMSKALKKRRERFEFKHGMEAENDVAENGG